MGGLIKPLVSEVDVSFCIYGSPPLPFHSSFSLILQLLFSASISRSGELRLTSALMSVIDVALLLRYGFVPIHKTHGLNGGEERVWSLL